jgi:hypothetical protein
MAACAPSVSPDQLSWQTTVPTSGTLVDSCIGGDGLYRRDDITNQDLDAQQCPDDGWRHSTERYYCVDDAADEVPIEDFWQDQDIALNEYAPSSSDIPFEYSSIVLF